MFGYIGSLVVRFFRIVFIQAKFQNSLSLSNLRMTTRTFKFIYHIASFQMCLLVLVLKIISNHMCFMNERQMSKFFQIFSKKVPHLFFQLQRCFVKVGQVKKNSSNVSRLFLLVFRSVIIRFVEKYFDLFVYKPVLQRRTSPIYYILVPIEPVLYINQSYTGLVSI